MNPNPVLIVDDEPDLCELVALTLSRKNLDSESTHDIKSAKALLQKNNYSLCLTDMRLPDGDGLELISYIQKKNPSLPVAMISAHGNMDTAISALKLGAFDFLSKPIDLKQLNSLVESALQLDSNNPDTQNLMTQSLAGNSLQMQDLRNLIVRVARSQAPVFIQGESGTGKEVVARLIHDNSVRSEKPFIAVNCGAIPNELVESELFGHKKGSFTGANEDKEGLFQAAHGGSLLLDEIADLPLNVQVKLLRAIQQKAIRPVGSNQEISVDVRILSATHKSLSQLVSEDRFRNDLYYRINVIDIRIPSLRERPEDIPPITQHILAKLALQQGLSRITISDEAVKQLQTHEFLGNVRELENLLERTMALTDATNIGLADLLFGNTSPASDPVNSTPNTSTPPSINKLPAVTSTTELITTIDPRGSASLDTFLEVIEKQEIVTAMESNRWNKTEAAKELGISFRSLRYRLKKLGLED